MSKNKNKNYYKAFSWKIPQEGKCLICSVIIFEVKVPITTAIVTKVKKSKTTNIS